MKFYKVIIFVGSLLLILPFLGIPDMWKQAIAAASGVFIIWVGLMIWRKQRYG